jgi:hypothetical protein
MLPDSLVPAGPPQVTDLMQTRKVLTALRDYLETPDGRVMAGSDFVEIHSAISMVSLAIERLTVAGPMVRR